MDKKNKNMIVLKRKSDEPAGEKKVKMVNREKAVVQVVELPEELWQQTVRTGQLVVHTGQLVEGNFEQPVFGNSKGEHIQLGPNTKIMYEQSNPSNIAFGGMWPVDQSGPIVMAEGIHDVKGQPEKETEVSNVSRIRI